MSTQTLSTIPLKGIGRAAVFIAIGVLLPIVAIVLESICHISALSFFDPVPTPLHVILLATVPVANLWLLYVLCFGKLAQVNKLAWLHSVALGIALVYAIVYARLFLLSFIGLVFFGIGLVPLAPLLALLAMIWGRNMLAPMVLRQQGGTLPGLWRGMLLALGLLVAAETLVAVRLFPAFREPDYALKALTIYQRWLHPLTETKMSWDLVLSILRLADAPL